MIAAVRDKRSFWAESNAQVAIVAFLRAALPSNYRVFAIPNGRFEAKPNTIARLKREGLTPGMPDLCILRSDGWCAFLEVKSEAGRMSPEQIEFSDWMASQGGCCAVVRGVGDVQSVLHDWNVPMKARAS